MFMWVNEKDEMEIGVLTISKNRIDVDTIVISIEEKIKEINNLGYVPLCVDATVGNLHATGIEEIKFIDSEIVQVLEEILFLSKLVKE